LIWNIQPRDRAGIACFKAVIVILFFMHVKYQSKLVKMTVGAGLLHLPRADYDDAERLHQPGVGSLVEFAEVVAIARLRVNFRALQQKGLSVYQSREGFKERSGSYDGEGGSVINAGATQ
jgi:hypothetical protein